MKSLLVTIIFISATLISRDAEATSESSTSSTPKLTISGQSTFNSWWFTNKRKTIHPVNPNKTCNYTGKGRGQLFTVDSSRIKFDIQGKTDPGMDYGFTIVIDGNTQQTSLDKSVKENYVYFGGTWGKLSMGDTSGVENNMAFYGADPLGGTGGFDGNFDRIINFTTGTVRSVDLVGDTGKFTKIVYHSPRWKGIQAGISYTPQVGHRGAANLNTLQGSQKGPLRLIQDRHSIAGGVNFINKFNSGWELALSATMLFGNAHRPCGKYRTFNFANSGQNINNVGPAGSILSGNNSFKNTNAFALGFLNTYKGVEWGGEFGWNGSSHELSKITYTNGANASSAKGKDSWFIDTGLGYTFGASKLSAGYFYGQRTAIKYRSHTDSLGSTKSRTHVFSAALDHKLAPGLLIFGEYAHFLMKNKGANIDRFIANASNKPSSSQQLETRSGDSHAFVVGTRIKF